jgi:hypothetical protein
MNNWKNTTENLQLPLIEATQSQKHITINEALTKLDATVNLVVKSANILVPPNSASEGDRYLVPAQTQHVDWTDHSGSIALWSNGGWIFIKPFNGWKLFAEDTCKTFLYIRDTWIPNVLVASQNSAFTQANIFSEKHDIIAGATSTTGILIPDKSIVFGITAHITETITGCATIKIGVNNNLNRYGTDISTLIGSFSKSIGNPTAYYGDQNVVITAIEGRFEGQGSLLVSVHTITVGMIF